MQRRSQPPAGCMYLVDATDELPLRIFSNRSLAASDATFLLVAAALFGMFYFCTLYLQQVLGYSALKTGVLYLPLSLTLIAASAGASRLVDRLTPKPVLVTGLLIATAGFIVLTQVSGHGDYVSHVLPSMVIIGIGIGMSFVPVTIAATNGIAPEDSGLPRACSTRPSKSADPSGWRYSPRSPPPVSPMHFAAARRCRSGSRMASRAHSQ